MVRVGLLVRLRARAGKESEVARLLEGALPAAEAEAQTRSGSRSGWARRSSASSTRSPTRPAARRTSAVRSRLR